MRAKSESNPRAVAVQFRYAFVTDEEGLKVIEMEAFYKSSGQPSSEPPGELYQVEDVRGEGARLNTRDGAPVASPQPFPSEPRKTVPPPARTMRLPRHPPAGQ